MLEDTMKNWLELDLDHWGERSIAEQGMVEILQSGACVTLGILILDEIIRLPLMVQSLFKVVQSSSRTSVSSITHRLASLRFLPKKLAWYSADTAFMYARRRLHEKMLYVDFFLGAHKQRLRRRCREAQTLIDTGFILSLLRVHRLWLC